MGGVASSKSSNGERPTASEAACTTAAGGGTGRGRGDIVSASHNGRPEGPERQRGCDRGFQIVTEGVRQLRHTRKSIRRGLRHRLAADGVQPGIHVRAELLDRRHRRGQDPADHDAHPAGVRRPPGEHLEQDHAERVDVGGRPDGRNVPLDLFGGHIAGSAEQSAVARQLGLVRVHVGDPLRQAEVHDHRLAAGRHHHVRRLQVAVDDPLAVGVFQGEGDLADDLGGADLRHRDFRIDLLFEGRAGDVSHGDERPAVDLPGVENGADVGMVQHRRRAGFAHEALGSLRRSGASKNGTFRAACRPSWESSAR